MSTSVFDSNSAMRLRSNIVHFGLALLLVTYLSSCAAVANMTGGEPPAKDDATPPSGYDPHYIKAVKALPHEPAKVQNAILEISRIDAREPNRVRIFAQLIDSGGNYLSGAALGKYKGKWCLVTDQVTGSAFSVIQKYKLKEVTEADRVPTAIAIVMDHSGSMGEERAQAIEEAAGDLIDSKRPEDALAMIKYDQKVKVEVPLTQNVSDLKLHLTHEGLTGFGGSTAILDALAAGLEQVEAAPVEYDNRAVALFTDGQDNSSSINQDSLVRAARHANVALCMIGFGDNVNDQFLQNVATATGGLFRRAYQTREITDLYNDLYKRLRNFYLFEYQPPGYGVHTVQIKLCLPHDTMVATGTYDNTPKVGDIAQMDVYFDLNSSKLLSSSNDALDNAVALLTAYPQLAIEVRGHTDSTNRTNDPDFNMRLSQKRADIVKAALVKRGVSEARIHAIGFGASQPVSTNSTEEGRALNRRTEFVIEDK